jgi:hypothetical protein
MTGMKESRLRLSWRWIDPLQEQKVIIRAQFWKKDVIL